MKRYKTVSDSSDSSSRMKDSDSLSVVSISSRSTTNHRRFNRNKRINSELSEPLTSPTSAGGDEESSSLDPYFVFRSDLQNKIELADEDLADFLRIVQETVRSQSLQPSQEREIGHLSRWVLYFKITLERTLFIVPIINEMIIQKKSF